jgi:hypothetical protein
MTNSKPVKQEVNGTVILPPLVFPGGAVNLMLIYTSDFKGRFRNKLARF